MLLLSMGSWLSAGASVPQIWCGLSPRDLSLAMDDYFLPWCCLNKGPFWSSMTSTSHAVAQAKRQQLFRFTIDQAFSQVIAACAAVPRSGESGT